MTPTTELDRLFAEAFPSIPKPDAPIDADETNYGVCAQEDCSDDS